MKVTRIYDCTDDVFSKRVVFEPEEDSFDLPGSFDMSIKIGPDAPDSSPFLQVNAPADVPVSLIIEETVNLLETFKTMYNL